VAQLKVSDKVNFRILEARKMIFKIIYCKQYTRAVGHKQWKIKNHNDHWKFYHDWITILVLSSVYCKVTNHNSHINAKCVNVVGTPTTDIKLASNIRSRGFDFRICLSCNISNVFRDTANHVRVSLIKWNAKKTRRWTPTVEWRPALPLTVAVGFSDQQPSGHV